MHLNFFHPNSPGEVRANSELPRTWPQDAQIVTYVSRGLEAMRGFDIFTIRYLAEIKGQGLA